MQQTEVKVSKRIEKILKDKVTEHNEDNPKYRATLGMLKAVFRRGVGAYNTNPSSVRPTVTSSDQWALARVNSFVTKSPGTWGKADKDLAAKVRG